ncbi:short-chain dehydrogenase TIC 32, chloroplastic-like [Phalaenopsis equestris]|uniref:short-chain dehydrogenase TIC 32, chloroplastic-like n=1 Tax=Phalaenopsis equestris TaxID=78828 RepID=UPI0009E56EE4|nr:short-chain dehydrogenase TIC 32, chloroplastic-like [Phalaenopsis equestris]
MTFMKWICRLVFVCYIWIIKLEFSAIADALRYIMGISGPSGFGSNSTGEHVTEGVSPLPQLTAIITGATSGIGAETARVLAKRGVRLVIPARDLKKARDVEERIKKKSPKADIIVMKMDLCSFASIQNFCSNFLSLGLPLNILINNAGKLCRSFELTENKLEMTVATNYMDISFNTTILLVYKVNSPTLCICALKFMHLPSDVRNKSYDGTRAYALSKLANIMHAKEIARQLKERKVNVTINSVHPGIVKTGIIRDHRGLITDLLFFLASKFLKSTAQGASTTCYIAINPQVNGISGKYFADCNESSCSPLADDDWEAFNLWMKTTILLHKFMS